MRYRAIYIERTTMLPFSVEDALQAIDDGWITRRKHPDLPLYILNYSPETQYRNYWNDVTLNCRGLIVDEDWNIVARPFAKFFNLGQVNLPIQFTDPVEVMDKADGSLGILYPTPWRSYRIATRGSFASEQALHATDVWRDKYSHLGCYLDKYLGGFTFLFEIIFKENRIVLNYGDMDDLVLLGAVMNDTGHYIGPREAAGMLVYPGPVVDVYDYNTISDALASMGRKNKEGYVVRSHNFMVKIKEPDYLELHRLVTNVSPKTVWEQLKAGKSKDKIVSAFPDEFHEYVSSMIDPLTARFAERFDEIFSNFHSFMTKLGLDKSRKDYAQEFKRHADARYYFLLLDNRPIRDTLWDELKPKEQNNVRSDNN